MTAPTTSAPTRAMLIFLSDVRGLEDLARDEQAMILRRTFDDVGWQAPRVLAALDDASMYFDGIAQAKLPRWSNGRGELDRRDDPRPALARYEELMRPFVDRAQTVRPAMLRALNPRAATGRTVQRAAFGLAAFATDKLGGLLDRFGRPPSDAIDLPDYPVNRRVGV